MDSPFPGMDPYLEQHWGDVHHNLITYARDQLQPGLPDDLRARVEERVFVAFEEAEGRGIYPDLRVVERRASQPVATAAEQGVAVAEPLVIHLGDEPVTEGYIEIIDTASGNRVVTVIELLSPANKVPGEGQNLYLKKQREVIAAAASLVEIDLTRSGKRVLALASARIPPSHRTTYQICVRRGYRKLEYEVYRVPLLERLPTIAVPLRQTDADAPLELQTLIDQCYRNGRYDDLNYRIDPDPPLDAADAAWSDQLLRTKGRR